MPHSFRAKWAFGTAAALASLAPCIAGASHLATAGATPYRAHSWVATGAHPAVYVSGGGFVNGYDPRTGNLLEQIVDGSGPSGLAVDGAGNLYVADRRTSQVIVYPPGSTTPSLTIAVGHNYLFGIAVSLTGELAVPATNAVYFYRKGATKPFSAVSSLLWSTINACAYDAAGNLYIDGYPAGIGSPLLGEIPGGGRGTAIDTFNVTNLSSPLGIEVDHQSHLLVVDESNGLYQYNLPNPTGPSATISLGSNFLDPGSIALTKLEHSMYVTSFSGVAGRFAYPAGGPPKMTITQSGATGVAVAPWAQP